MNFLKRQLPVLLAFGFGMFFWLQYFIPAKWSQDALEEFTASWLIIIVAAALILGVLSAIHYHSTKIRRKRAGWAYSIITLVAFVITAIVGLISNIGGTQIAWPGFPAQEPGGTDAVALGDHSPLQWIFSYIFNPLDSTLFALLAFFIASAAFRAFRARSPEATVLLVAGCIMMLGRVPVGTLIHVFPELNGSGQWFTLSDVSQWIFDVPNSAAQRGILFGVVLSQIAISLRIIFGIERTYMGGGED
ncbi:MAG: hypothetical protein M3R04_01305 [bacterium]|nr:hypothetical protein [bacterium]